MQRIPITIISGSRKGIGRALAEYYVQQGHHVIGCSRTEHTWEADRYEHFTADVGDESVVVRMFKSIQKRHGRLDNLINNAGTASMNHSLLTPMSTVEEATRTNFLGAFLLAREAAKLMKRHRFGRIVNFSTVAVPLKIEGEAAYVASKAAVEALTCVMARELAQFNITVNSVGPAPIATDLIASVPKEKLDALIERQAIARYATIDDIVNVVDFFLSERSSFVTGQCLYLGGV